MHAISLTTVSPPGGALAAPCPDPVPRGSSGGPVCYSGPEPDSGAVDAGHFRRRPSRRHTKLSTMPRHPRHLPSFSSRRVNHLRSIHVSPGVMPREETAIRILTHGRQSQKRLAVLSPDPQACEHRARHASMLLRILIVAVGNSSHHETAGKTAQIITNDSDPPKAICCCSVHVAPHHLVRLSPITAGEFARGGRDGLVGRVPTDRPPDASAHPWISSPALASG